MFKFVDADRTTIQSDQHPGLNIPAIEDNARYRELVMPWLAQGNRIADFVPDPAAAAAARKAKMASNMMQAIADDAYVGKSLDQIRAEVTAAMPADDVGDAETKA